HTRCSRDWSSDVCSSDRGLKWGEAVGGAEGLIARAEGNLAAIAEWVGRTPWIDFLAADPRTRSCTSVCLKIVDPWFAALPEGDQTGRASCRGNGEIGSEV